MSKIAIITDQHFGCRNDSKYFLDNYEKFYAEIFFPALIANGIKTLLILGDTWENRKTLNLNTFVRAQEMFFDKLRDLGIDVKMIYGNHDVYYKNSNGVNSVDMLGRIYPNIEVVPTHKVFDFDGLKVGMLSWVNNDNFKSSMEFIETADCSILCGHFEIKSFDMIRGVACDHGFDKSIFERYEAVYSGHFHTISTDGRILYITNPSQTNWSDYGLKKGFRLLDTQTKELTLIQNPFDVYAKIAYNDEIDVVNFDYEEYRNKIVRVYIQSFAQSNQQKVNLFVERLNQFAHATDVFEIDESMSGGEMNSDGVDFADTAQVINQYINDVVDSELVDKNRLLMMFMDLYHEASQQVDIE
jgi:DNA repair exonuclease SbcCD nuclease subunit